MYVVCAFCLSENPFLTKRTFPAARSQYNGDIIGTDKQFIILYRLAVFTNFSVENPWWELTADCKQTRAPVYIRENHVPHYYRRISYRWVSHTYIVFVSYALAEAYAFGYNKTRTCLLVDLFFILNPKHIKMFAV